MPPNSIPHKFSCIVFRTLPTNTWKIITKKKTENELRQYATIYMSMSAEAIYYAGHHINRKIQA